MKINRRYVHMISSIEAEPGLVDDCTHMVYLTDGYEHCGYGDSFPIRNSKELNRFMADVQPINDTLIDIACLTKPKDFYKLSNLDEVRLKYYEGDTLVELITYGEILIHIFFSDISSIFDKLNFNKIIRIEAVDKTYVIHGYDIAWWRKHLKLLSNSLLKLESADFERGDK